MLLLALSSRFCQSFLRNFFSSFWIYASCPVHKYAISDDDEMFSHNRLKYAIWNCPRPAAVCTENNPIVWMNLTEIAILIDSHKLLAMVHGCVWYENLSRLRLGSHEFCCYQQASLRESPTKQRNWSASNEPQITTKERRHRKIRHGKFLRNEASVSGQKKKRKERRKKYFQVMAFVAWEISK